MGSRGASSGMSKRGGVEYPYGSEFKTVLQQGNIKFVMAAKEADSARTPMETMTKGRVYATVNAENEVKAITFYDKKISDISKLM